MYMHVHVADTHAQHRERRQGPCSARDGQSLRPPLCHVPRSGDMGGNSQAWLQVGTSSVGGKGASASGEVETAAAHAFLLRVLQDFLILFLLLHGLRRSFGRGRGRGGALFRRAAAPSASSAAASRCAPISGAPAAVAAAALALVLLLDPLLLRPSVLEPHFHLRMDAHFRYG